VSHNVGSPPLQNSSADLTARVDLRQAPTARKADALPFLVRLLRRLAEADESAARAADKRE
jgi:hypothetical protein